MEGSFVKWKNKKKKKKITGLSYVNFVYFASSMLMVKARLEKP